MENNELLSGIVEGSEPFYLVDMAKNGPVIYVTNNDKSAKLVIKQISFLRHKLNVYQLPEWDNLPYDNSSVDKALMAERAKTLVEISSSKVDILVLSAKSFIQAVPPKEEFFNKKFSVQKGDTVDFKKLKSMLANFGYFRCGKVSEAGDYSIRGSIIDVFPASSDIAYRIELFGDLVEEVRTFNPLDQSSKKSVDKVVIHLASELVLNESRVQKFKNKYKRAFGLPKKDDYLYHSVSEGQTYIGYENYLPLFFDKTNYVFECFDKPKIVYNTESIASLTNFTNDIEDYYTVRKNFKSDKLGLKAKVNFNVIEPSSFYLTEDLQESKLENYSKTIFSSFSDLNETKNLIEKYYFKTSVKSNPQEKFENKLLQLQGLLNLRTKVVLCFNSLGVKSHLTESLRKRDIELYNVSTLSDVKLNSSIRLYSTVLSIANSLITKDAVFIKQEDLLGDRFSRKIKRSKKASDLFRQDTNLDLNSLTIHRQHGLGKFKGIETISINNIKHDMLKIEYHGGDGLFVPVENMEIISPHSGDSDNVLLDKLGGNTWKAKKARLEEKIKITADELLNTAAKRKTNKTAPASYDIDDLETFARAFPFNETEDQLSAVNDILDDMSSEVPMDRLVCGDVGFGKTEVAMRACYAAVLSGKQVILICPTTLLCRQHYHNFIDRFKNFGVKIEQLSRLVPYKEAKQNKLNFSKGNIDILVGTHALLSEDLEAKNLGLIVVDEEQNFGVSQKEKLKKLKEECNYLSLSATPIPRTLQLSLSGISSLSTIVTPPVDRLPVKTYVLPFDPLTIREAILREKNRAGRVFFVVPKIKDIEKMHGELKILLPEINIAVAHGQMPVNNLENIMSDFYEGKYDLLLSTSIVESGLDIKTANTIIVHKANLFGLSALYQLRGRVGRGKVRAFCYFTLEHGKQFTKNALKRLDVMQNLKGLGAGFTVASHDMDIRGYGNILGDEQSGHIKDVGIELYQQMLDEAIAKIKSEHDGNKTDDNNPEDFSPVINFGISVTLPEQYIEDLSTRMEIYKKASQIGSISEIDNFKIDLVDRFGEYPVEIEQFIKTIELKILCKKAGVEKLDNASKNINIKVKPNFHNSEKLLQYVMKNSENMKIKPNDKISIRCDKTSIEERLEKVIFYLRSLSEL